MPPATDSHYALGVHHFIYSFSGAFKQTTSHDAANSPIRATDLTKFSVTGVGRGGRRLWQAAPAPRSHPSHGYIRREEEEEGAREGETPHV